MAVTIQLKCPACGRELAFPAEAAGTISICGACGGPVIVPEVPAEHLATEETHRSDEPPHEPPPPFPFPPEGLISGQTPPPLNSSFPPHSTSPQSAIPDLPLAPDPPPIVKRSGPIPHLSPESMQTLNEMEQAAYIPPTPPPPPPRPVPLYPPPVPQNLPSEIPEYLPGPVAPVPPERENDYRIIWLTAGGAALVVLIAVLIIWYSFFHKTSWEVAHHDEIESLIESAEDSAAQHDYAGAWEKYRKVKDLVSG